MLKLKIGKNYLLTSYNEIETIDGLPVAIPYMMSSFEGTNLLAVWLGLSAFNGAEIAKSMDALRTNKVYILEYLEVLKFKKNRTAEQVNEIIRGHKENLAHKIAMIREIKPLAEIKVININAYMNKPGYKVAKALFQELLGDETSILSILPRLETYKYMTQRYQAIPNEIKIIENDLKRLSKTVKVCDRMDTLDSLKYLKLIESAELRGTNLRLTLNQLPIYPSEPLGRVFYPENFQNNPYLYKAASYIYQGYHFQMPKTIIEVDTCFRLHFIETLDHTFDKMFRANNWSGVGYPHFGDNGFCPGEFNDTMAHGREYGLGYYFTSLKQYLTTANMRDTAGYRVFWYPIYDDEGNMVYCAALDAVMEEYIKKYNTSLYEKLQHMPWEERAYMLKDFDYRNSNAVMRYHGSNMSYSYRGDDCFLSLCKQRDIDLYNKIMEGRKD